MRKQNCYGRMLCFFFPLCWLSVAAILKTGLRAPFCGVGYRVGAQNEALWDDLQGKGTLVGARAPTITNSRGGRRIIVQGV